MSLTWQLDFYRRPLRDAQGQPLWELLVCSSSMNFSYGKFCPQSEASAQWLKHHLQIAFDRAGEWPTCIQVFRPQALGLAEAACRELSIQIQPQREVLAIKQWLQQRTLWYANLPNYTEEPYDPLAIDRPPPQPMPQQRMGENWQFAAIAREGLTRLGHEPIPLGTQLTQFDLLSMGLSSTLLIPGVILEGGRQSMALAQWLESVQPVMLQYIPGTPDGLLLEAGLADRWILATFDDPEVAEAARTFSKRKQLSQGLHFLLVRPDSSGMTYSGLWLMQSTPGKEVQTVSRN